MEHCSQCGGTLKIIAAIEHPPVITKILTRLGLPARAPPRAAAKAFDRLTGLIPHRTAIPSGSAPEPTLPLGPRSPETPKRSET